MFYNLTLKEYDFINGKNSELDKSKADNKSIQKDE